MAFVEGALKGAVGFLLKMFPPDKLGVMIDNKYLPITSVYYNANGMKTDKDMLGLSKEELFKIEKIRGSTFLNKTLIPLLEQGRTLARNIPPELVSGKITPEWLKQKGFERYPNLLKTVQSKGEAGEEWLKLVSAEIVLYLTGHLYWDGQKKTMVIVE